MSNTNRRMFGPGTPVRVGPRQRDDLRMESRWYYLGGFAAAAVFAVLMWLILGPLPALIGFVFIALVAFAPMLRRR